MLHSYEPELFPGLVYRMMQPKCTLLIFVTGKIVITGKLTCLYIRAEKYIVHIFLLFILGGKSREDIYQAFDNIYPILKSFKKQ